MTHVTSPIRRFVITMSSYQPHAPLE
jgi:hypothetical protein